MSQDSQTTARTPADEANDWVWGAEAIGDVVGRTPAQVRYLFSIGFFGDAVWKAGHKTFIGDRRRLQCGDGFRRLPRKSRDRAGVAAA
jgi:hypothetical protein